MDSARHRAWLRTRVPIAELIGETVSLSVIGGTLRGSCPSHPDPGLGLHVDDRSGSYLCFACRRQGDVVRWTMEQGGVSEDVAIAKLTIRAERGG